MFIRKKKECREYTALDALAALRGVVSSGLHDQRERQVLVTAATSGLPSDPRVELLRNTMSDLLQTIEVENILGADTRLQQEQLARLLDWVERHNGSFGLQTAAGAQ